MFLICSTRVNSLTRANCTRILWGFPMSIEMNVFFRGELPDTAALTRTMQELGFPISFAPQHYPLEGQAGFRPMVVRGKASGAEVYVDEGRDAIKEIAIPERLKDIDP